MKPRRTPPKRTAHSQAPELEPAPRVLSGEEKYELIRAHAEARKAHPNKLGLGYYIAIAASCLVVASGWLYTLDRGLWIPPREPDPALQELEDTTAELKRQWNDAREQVKESISELSSTTTPDVQ
jgi:hypothetical protein